MVAIVASYLVVSSLILQTDLDFESETSESFGKAVADAQRARESPMLQVVATGNSYDHSARECRLFVVT
jgi:hypothetical protein